MRRLVLVRLGEGGRSVGELIHENDGRREHSVFSYDPEWLRAPDSFALSPHLPIDGNVFHGTAMGNRSAIPAVMMDGAPDSWGREVIRRSLGRHCDDFDYLVESDDWLRTGALRYFDEDGNALAPERVDRVPRLSDMGDLIAAARSFESDPGSYLEHRDRFMQVAGSLGGARPKVGVVDDAGVLWIAKLARAGDTLPVAKGEVLALKLAEGVKLSVAGARLLDAGGGHPVALIRRFDRAAGGRRRHFMSAQTMLGIDGAESGDYVSMADALREWGLDPRAQMAELHRRLQYTILVSNVDDHLRNHGFIYAGEGRWGLSPAYDINPEPDRGGHLKTAISEIHGFRPSIEAAIAAAPYFDLDEDHAASSAKVMAGYIRDAWRPLAESLGMSATEIKQYAGAFEHAESDKALCFGGIE